MNTNNNTRDAPATRTDNCERGQSKHQCHFQIRSERAWMERNDDDACPRSLFSGPSSRSGKARAGCCAAVSRAIQWSRWGRFCSLAVWTARAVLLLLRGSLINLCLAPNSSHGSNTVQSLRRKSVALPPTALPACLATTPKRRITSCVKAVASIDHDLTNPPD